MPDTVLLAAEQKLFKEELAEFWKLYHRVFKEAEEIAERRSKKYDTTPLHLRWTPLGFAHEVRKKILRAEGVMEQPGWFNDADALQNVLQELPDILNYTGYLAALLLQLRGCLVESSGADVLDPEFRGEGTQ